MTCLLKLYKWYNPTMKISNYLNRIMLVELFPIFIYTSNHNYYSYLPFPHFLIGPASSPLIHRMDSQSLYSLPFLCVFFFCCFPYTTSMISFSFPDFLPIRNTRRFVLYLIMRKYTIVRYIGGVSVRYK